MWETLVTEKYVCRVGEGQVNKVNTASVFLHSGSGACSQPSSLSE